MAQRITIIDDLDETPDAETVTFALDGKHYQIDLAAENQAALRGVLAPYVDAGRAVGKTKPTRSGRSKDTAVIRDWALSRGYQVKDRGRIPGDVVAAYRAAQG